MDLSGAMKSEGQQAWGKWQECVCSREKEQ